MYSDLSWMNVAIIMGVSLAALIILGIFTLIGLKIIKGGGSKKSKAALADETRLIQEIFQGLQRMENRVEALETILYDREKVRET